MIEIVTHRETPPLSNYVKPARTVETTITAGLCAIVESGMYFFPIIVLSVSGLLAQGGPRTTGTQLGGKSNQTLLEQALRDNRIAFVQQESGLAAKDSGVPFEAKAMATSIRLQYRSACTPERGGLQVFLRESGIVKAFESETGDTVLEAHLLYNPPLSAAAVSAFLVQFRNMIDAYRAGAERTCAVSPKSVGEATEVSSNAGKFKIRIDLEEWRQTPGRTDNTQQFAHRSGEAYVMILSERTSFPLESLREIALGNARNVDPDAKVLLEEVRKVSGRDVLHLEITAKHKGVGFHYMGRYYAGSSGTIQLVSFSLAERYAEHRERMSAVLDSLVIEDEPKKGSYLSSGEGSERQTSELNGGKAAIEYDRTMWKVGKSEAGRHEWNDKSGRALAVFITEPLTVKSEDLAEIAIENLKTAASEYKVKGVGPGQVNGIPMTCVDAEVTMNKIPFVYRGCFWGGNKESYQLVGMVLKEHAEEMNPVMAEFWRGFRIIPAIASPR